MGMVFKAHKERLAREFAIKILAPHLATDPELVARFEEEARVQSSLRHPHIVDVVDSIAADGAYAFVMELIDGPTLQQVLADRRGALSLPRILAIMDAVLDAAGYAHEHDVIHRDLKPGNILLARLGGREVVKVADFGLARMLGSQRRTASGATLGTYVYMSPEQCRGDLDVDHRTDLFPVPCSLTLCPWPPTSSMACAAAPGPPVPAAKSWRSSAVGWRPLPNSPPLRPRVPLRARGLVVLSSPYPLPCGSWRGQRARGGRR